MSPPAAGSPGFANCITGRTSQRSRLKSQALFWGREMRVLMVFCGLLALLLPLAQAGANDAPGRVVMVQVQIERDSQTVATPDVVAQADDPGVVELFETCRLVITPQVEADGRVRLNLALYLPGSNGWRLTETPQALVRFGDSDTLHFSDHAGHHYRLRLTPRSDVLPAAPSGPETASF